MFKPIKQKRVYEEIGLIIETMRSSRQCMFQTSGNKEKLFAQHQKIFQAIAARNPKDAREAMKEHLIFVIKEITYYEEEREGVNGKHPGC